MSWWWWDRLHVEVWVLKPLSTSVLPSYDRSLSVDCLRCPMRLIHILMLLFYRCIMVSDSAKTEKVSMLSSDGWWESVGHGAWKSIKLHVKRHPHDVACSSRFKFPAHELFQVIIPLPRLTFSLYQHLRSQLLWQTVTAQDEGASLTDVPVPNLQGQW